MVMAGDRPLPRTVEAQRDAQGGWDPEGSGAVDWGYLYEQYAQPLRALIARRLPNGEPVEDILHDTFARAIRSTPLIDTDRPPWPFLATVAGRAVADWWARADASRPVEHPVGAATDDYPGSDAHALSLDRVMGARRALLALTPRHRRVLYLYEGEGWSYETLTEAEQVSVQAMKSLLGRARSCFHARYREIVAGDAALGLLVGLRTALNRLRARLDRWEGWRGWESLAAIGGMVVAGAIIGGATSPVASATIGLTSPSSVSFSGALDAPALATAETVIGHAPSAGNRGPAVVHRQPDEAARPSPSTSRLLDAGGSVVNGPHDSIVSFYVEFEDPVLLSKHRFGTETHCEKGEVAARKCQVIRSLPGKG